MEVGGSDSSPDEEEPPSWAKKLMKKMDHVGRNVFAMKEDVEKVGQVAIAAKEIAGEAKE